jgi:hypothetical protein
MIVMQAELDAVAEREMEEPEEGDPPSAATRAWSNEDPAPRWSPDTRRTRWDAWPSWPSVPSWEDGAGLDVHPFELPVEAGLLSPFVFCGWADPVSDSNDPFPDAHARYCRTEIVTPFGLRGPDVPRMRDLLGRDPGDPWPSDYERARRALKPPATPQGFGRGVPRAAIPVAFPSVAVAVTFRGAPRAVIRAPRHDLRACYFLGLAENPRLEGAVSFSFTVGRDGVMHLRADAPPTLLDARVGRCAFGALDGLRVEPPPQVVSGIYRVDMKLTPGRRP